MIMIEWWQTGAIGALVFVVVLLADRISARADERRQRQWDEAHGPYPCFTHMGTTVDQRQIWCHEVYGHDGPHTSEWGLTQAEIDEDLSEPGGPDAEEIWPVKEWRAERGRDGKLIGYSTPAEPENLRMARPPATACLRSSSCYLPDGHQEQCWLTCGD